MARWGSAKGLTTWVLTGEVRQALCIPSAAARTCAALHSASGRQPGRQASGARGGTKGALWFLEEESASCGRALTQSLPAPSCGAPVRALLARTLVLGVERRLEDKDNLRRCGGWGGGRGGGRGAAAVSRGGKVFFFVLRCLHVCVLLHWSLSLSFFPNPSAARPCSVASFKAAPMSLLTPAPFFARANESKKKGLGDSVCCGVCWCLLVFACVCVCVCVCCRDVRRPGARRASRPRGRPSPARGRQRARSPGACSRTTPLQCGEREAKRGG